MRRLFITCAALVLMYVHAFADWESLCPLPEGNGGFACGFIAGRLIIAGGTLWKDDQKQWLSVIRCYDPQTRQWSTLGQLPNAWAYGASGVIHDHLILAGGSDGKRALRDILAVDANGRCRVLGDLPKGLVYTAGAVSGERLVMAGGATDPVDLATFTSDVLLIDFGAASLSPTARTLPGLGGRGFGIGTASASGSRVFVFGGAQPGVAASVTNIGTVHELDLLGAVVPTAAAARLPSAIRGITALALTDGQIYLAGGYPGDEAGFTDAAWLFDPATRAFAPAKPLPVKAMIHLTRNGEWVYALGGEDKKKHRMAAMWRIREGGLK